MRDIQLSMKWFPAILRILNDDARFKVVRKGRRAGWTHHIAQYFIVQALQKDNLRMMWGDTTHSNIIRYVDIYFMPVLKQLPQEMWSWNKQEKLLRIRSSHIDFRSADRPENWEGFGYHIVHLNEAGIILRNRYLWENAVRPMLLDYHRSTALIGGTPKGRNLFYELYEKGLSATNKHWKSYHLTTYDNPLLSPEDIEEMKKDLGHEPLIRQEIYGEFVDSATNALFTYEELQRAAGAVVDAYGQTVWGLDVARQGADLTALAKRTGRVITEIKTVHIDDTMKIAEWLAHEYKISDPKPERIYIDVTQLGWGVFDRARQFNLPVVAANVAEPSVQPNMLNKRAEMYFRLKEELFRMDGAIPNDPDLIAELMAVEYEHHERTGKIKLVSKDKIKDILGRSPDRADAVALTFFDPVVSTKRRKIDTRVIRARIEHRILDPVAGY